MHDILSALNLTRSATVVNREYYPSLYAVSDLAAASVGAVGNTLDTLCRALGLTQSDKDIVVDQRLASKWFNMSIVPNGWSLPPIWDAVAGDYATKDGWIKLHTNLAHHRKAALSVLGVPAERDKVATAVKSWDATSLEAEIVGAGGVAAAMRSCTEWQKHPQGIAIKNEPLIAWSDPVTSPLPMWQPTVEKPLAGLKVLDLTRVLAGPVATRTLAAFGANVLRIDPPGWDEANIVPDITLGKRCVFIDLKSAAGLAKLKELLHEAHVLVHGYRLGALDALGIGKTARGVIAPNLIDVSLNAYGHTGPWAQRRGFDSLVQMSTGIAHAGMKWADASQPTPLPVQALDHATGYLMAAAVIRALTSSIEGKGDRTARLSLARTADLLTAHPQKALGNLAKEAEPDDLSRTVEQTPWGMAYRLKPPLDIEGTPMHWDRPACALGSATANW